MPSLFERLPAPHLPYGTQPCPHDDEPVEGLPKLVVLTGGPGAGKTAVLLAARASFCRHVAAIPEAATIIFGGGFPRHDTRAGLAAAQRAIFHVQREGERLVEDERIARAALCDRGTIDGAAYWPGSEDEYWAQFDVTREQELARYELVVHLRPPTATGGYVTGGERTEDARLAREIDDRIAHAWRGHPNRVEIEPALDFQYKLTAALEVLRSELPASLS